jgi:hypothetical protein
VSFYSDEELQLQPRNKEIIGEREWNALRSMIYQRIEDGSFGQAFPLKCVDGGVIGADRNLLFGKLPGFVDGVVDHGDLVSETPSTNAILDLITFCWRHIAEPLQDHEHEYFRHWHLRFNQIRGRKAFCVEVNTLFLRNRLQYEVTDEGTVIRLGSTILHNKISGTRFNTGDLKLNELLDEACQRFLSPAYEDRQNAVDKLWKSWERLKTLESPDKKTGVALLLDQIATTPEFRDTVEKEATELTKIGNAFGIRHSEMNQEYLNSTGCQDYVFERLFSFIYLLLKETDRL